MLVCKSKLVNRTLYYAAFISLNIYGPVVSVCVQEVSLGDDVTLLALPFAEDPEDLDPSLSFKWRKRSPKIRGSKNELEFKASSNSHFKGFISCEISKNQKPFFTVYHCLKESVGKIFYAD